MFLNFPVEWIINCKSISFLDPRSGLGSLGAMMTAAFIQVMFLGPVF